jgi:hypothetical protein
MAAVTRDASTGTVPRFLRKTFEEVGSSSQIQIQLPPRQVKSDLPTGDSAHSEMFPSGSKKILKTNSDA